MKYFLSVGAIFKNESSAMKEWIDHYIKEGVEHFYLIDNGSTDNYIDILKQYNCITLFHDSGSGIQIQAYNKYIYPDAVKESEYIGIFDLDEFAYADNDETISSILKKEPLCNYDHIWCPWHRFGSSGHIQQPKSIINGFIKRREPKGDVLGKSIVKTSSLIKLGIHHHKIIPNSTYILSNGDTCNLNREKQYLSEDIEKKFMIRVNHYEIQSYDWFTQIKMTRGDVHKGISYNKYIINNYTFESTDRPSILTDTRLLEKKYKEYS
jgi:hypothetical protein